jgi:hypothetical protein
MNEIIIIRIMVSAIMLSIFGVWYCILKLVDILRHIYKLLDELVKAGLVCEIRSNTEKET